MYNPYIISNTTDDSNPFSSAKNDETNYNVPTYNANNTNGY